MVEPGRELSFAAESLALGGRGHRAREDHLECHLAPNRLLLGPVDDAHSAPGNLLDQNVIANLLVWGRPVPAAIGREIRDRAVGVVMDRYRVTASGRGKGERGLGLEKGRVDRV